MEHADDDKKLDQPEIDAAGDEIDAIVTRITWTATLGMELRLPPRSDSHLARLRDRQAALA